MVVSPITVTNVGSNNENYHDRRKKKKKSKSPIGREDSKEQEERNYSFLKKNFSLSPLNQKYSPKENKFRKHIAVHYKSNYF